MNDTVKTNTAADASPASTKMQKSNAMRPEIIRLGIALLGGILVLNSYMSKVLFKGAVDPAASNLSAFLCALVLSLPIFWEAIHDLITEA